jgi:membrane protease YdiL (CAAX protease family)
MRIYLSNIKAIATINIILFWAVFVGLLFISGSFIVPLLPRKWSSFAYGIFGTVSAIIALVIFLRKEKQGFRNIGLMWEEATVKRFITGILIGSVLFILMLSFLFAMTDLRLQKSSVRIDGWKILGYLAFIPLGLMEELAFRSYSMIKLNRIFGLRITQVIVAIAFALYHAIGGQSLYISFLGPGTWAFVFGLAAIWSGGIAMPLGIHVALNILQSMAGMKGSYLALWTIKYQGEVTAASMATTETVGMIVQLVILIGALICTEYYLRKIKPQKLVDTSIKI